MSGSQDDEWEEYCLLRCGFRGWHVIFTHSH